MKKLKPTLKSVSKDFILQSALENKKAAKKTKEILKIYGAKGIVSVVPVMWGSNYGKWWHFLVIRLPDPAVWSVQEHRCQDGRVSPAVEKTADEARMRVRCCLYRNHCYSCYSEYLWVYDLRFLVFFLININLKSFFWHNLNNTLLPYCSRLVMILISCQSRFVVWELK